MTSTEFIEKAIEGGWNPTDEPHHFVEGDIAFFYDEEYTEEGSEAFDIRYILLDLEAWKAVGKVEGWTVNDSPVQDWDHEWLQKMHGMVDALAEGKTIEQYLETL